MISLVNIDEATTIPPPLYGHTTHRTQPFSLSPPSSSFLLVSISLKQEQANLAASSIGSIVNGSSSGNGKEPIVAGTMDVQFGPVEVKAISTEASNDSSSNQIIESKEGGPKYP